MRLLRYRSRYARNDLRAVNLRLVLAVLALSQLSACAHQAAADRPGRALHLSSGLGECRSMLTVVQTSADGELDASKISLFNWNVHKTRDVGWQDDYASIGSGADLILLQEASLREPTIGELDSTRHWTFAPGYRKWGEVTGVMTLSTVKPLAQCSFVHREPLLRTPKATSVMRFALEDTDLTLVVVNVHAVNFSFGLGAFKRQFEQIREVLEGHDGPIILSGDLNTWRKKRVKIVDELAASLEMTAVSFANDHRVRVFGNALDHIYVRGLQALDANTEVVDTSDHNPMSAVLSL